MPQQGPEAQFRFLIACIRNSNNGKVDFDQVAVECEIISKGAAAKRYERMMKANGINQAPPSIRDAPTASRPRKKKTSPDPPVAAPTPKKRKHEKSEDAPTSGVKLKKGGMKTKANVERDGAPKADPELLGGISGGANDYPWYHDTLSQHIHDSQHHDTDAVPNEHFPTEGFEPASSSSSSSNNAPPYPHAKYPATHDHESPTTIDPFDLDPPETLACRYPYLDVKAEHSYVSPYEVHHQADAFDAKFPYLKLKREGEEEAEAYVSSYGAVDTAPMGLPAPPLVPNTHAAALRLEDCGGGFVEESGGLLVEGPGARVKEEREGDGMGSILIAD